MEIGCLSLAGGDCPQAPGDGGRSRHRAYQARAGVDRARAVAAVESVFEQRSQRRELREWNAAVKKARKEDPSIRSQEFVQARKAAMLEAVARRANGS
jgi:hypothetical protein